MIFSFTWVDAASVAIVDPALDPGEATALVLSWVTAYQLLQRDARVHEGQKLLVLGAEGVSFLRVGTWLAKLWWWNAFSATRSASFFSITSTRKKHPAWFVADLGLLLGMLGRGEVKPLIAERIGLEAVRGAHAQLERGGVEGKIILVPNG